MCMSPNSDGERIIIESAQDREQRLNHEQEWKPPTYMTHEEARSAGVVAVDPQRHIPPRRIRHDT